MICTVELSDYLIPYFSRLGISFKYVDLTNPVNFQEAISEKQNGLARNPD